MWHIKKAISLKDKVDGADIWMAPNITSLLDEDDLKSIGARVWEGFRRDKLSRAKWEKRTQNAMDMAMQIQKGKSFPWPGCANVVFPLISISCLQFHSRAYPAMISGTDIVRYRVIGADPKGQEYARAQRIGTHMSYQVLEEDQAWEEQHDRLMLNVPIVGCAFVKTFHKPGEGNVSELVVAQDLVVDYYAKSVETAARKSQLMPVYRNEIYSGVVEGKYRDILDEPWYNDAAKPIQFEPGKAKEDNRKGVMAPVEPDEDTPYTFIEQHCRLDLDGDGYAEPWIVTIESDSHCPVRIVAGWDKKEQMEYSIYGRLSRIHSTEYYTKYGFIPSADGSIYDVGFGVLLGPLNSVVNAVINQLLDAGTLATTSGGFLARGAKIRGGQYTFNQFGWNRVDVSGDDLQKSIFPMPVREPSTVLFQLLGFIVEYAQRLGASTDALSGVNPGQNTPAQTQQSMVEQGMKIYSALFKRMWRSMKEEFRKLYCLNAIYLPDSTIFGDNQSVLKQDYMADPKRIAPAADPNMISEQQQYQKAVTLKQFAQTTPGYDIPAVERRVLAALKVEDPETVYPGPDKVPPLPNPKGAIETIKGQNKMNELQAKGQIELKKFAIQMAEEHELNKAKIILMEAQAAQAMEEAGGVQTGHEIAAFNAAIGVMKTHNEGLRDRMQAILKSLEITHDANQAAADGGGMGSMDAAPSNGSPNGVAGQA